MRNRYRAALRTSWRWNLASQAFVLALLTCVVGPAVVRGEVPWAAELIFLFICGIRMAEHLKEMLGSERSGVTPGLHRTHLVIAGALTATFGLVLPGAVAWMAGRGDDRALAFVAVTFAAIVIPTCLSKFKFLNVLIWILFASACFLVVANPFELNLHLTKTGSAVLFAVSLGCVIDLAIRFARMRGETPGDSKRVVGRTLFTARSKGNEVRTAEILFQPLFRFRLSRNLHPWGAKLPGRARTCCAGHCIGMPPCQSGGPCFTREQ